MRPDEFVVELDAQDLRVENDLLMHEVAYLRGRINYLEGRSKSLGDVQAAERAKTHQVEELLAQVKKEKAAATKDLLWLLAKLDNSPIGWIVRRRSGFRNLAQRWGTDQQAS